MNAPTDPRVAHDITDPEGIRSLFHLPIEISGEVLGVLGIDYCAPNVFTCDEERMLESLAQCAALTTENIRLYERAKQVATYDEHQRLVHDLHDALRKPIRRQPHGRGIAERMASRRQFG